MQSYSEHPGWMDVVPVPQDDGPNAVVTIAYTPHCKHFTFFLVTDSMIVFLQLRFHMFRSYPCTDCNFLVRKLMDLFRAVLRSGELSERVLELTEEILDENAANYTVW